VLAIAVIALVGFLLKPNLRTEPLSAGEAAFLNRLRLVGVLILAAGLPAAGVAFMNTTQEPAAGAIGYVVEGGGSYPITPANSKRYNVEMEKMEGKEGVIFAEFTDWFKGLWHGRKFAWTLLVLSAGGSACCFLVARVLLVYPPLQEATVRRR
jgi:hypothetical protein